MEPEAEYPQGLCQALADGMCKLLLKEFQTAKHAQFDFTEVFSGPRAPLSVEMAQRQVKDTTTEGMDSEQFEDLKQIEYEPEETRTSIRKRAHLLSREEVEQKGELTRTGR